MQGTMTYPPAAQADGDEEELQSETYVGVVALEGFISSLYTNGDWCKQRCKQWLNFGQGSVAATFCTFTYYLCMAS